jgi:hypothetical protein
MVRTGGSRSLNDVLILKCLIWEGHSVIFKERELNCMDENMEGRKKNMQFVLEPSHRFVVDRGKHIILYRDGRSQDV